MSPDAQRIAIAEACGWKSIGREKNLPLYGWVSPGPLEEIPDYLHDLNAMHEAEKVLTYNSLFTYGKELCWVCAASQHDRVSLVPEVFSATAAQRAEAFLRTLGKWEDGK